MPGGESILIFAVSWPPRDIWTPILSSLTLSPHPSSPWLPLITDSGIMEEQGANLPGKGNKEWAAVVAGPRSAGIRNHLFPGWGEPRTKNWLIAISRRWHRLEVRGLRETPELDLAVQQGERWDPVTDWTLTQHYSKRRQHNSWAVQIFIKAVWPPSVHIMTFFISARWLFKVNWWEIMDGGAAGLQCLLVGRLTTSPEATQWPRNSI